MARPQPSALDGALGELYAAPPEDFILVRTRLARELRQAGEEAAAVEVRGRRRPNLAAWACNQLARRQPEALDRLLDATRRAAAAHGSAVAGRGADDLRRTARVRQELLEQLADDGVAILRTRAPKPEAYRESIAATLDAATLDAEASDDLRAGRLTRTLSAPAGFGPPAGAGRPAAPTGRDRDDAARRELREARRDAEELRAAAKTAASEQASAEMRADAASAHLREVERALERARASAEQASKQAQAARAHADAARAAVDEAEQRLRAAERRPPASRPD